MICRLWRGWTTPGNADAPDSARAVFGRFDERAVHYEVIDRRAQ